MALHSSLVVLLICCALFQSFGFDDVVNNCGGFVKPSKELLKTLGSDKKLDVANIKVHLVTQEGQIKYTTDCAPNGYYIIPVYDKGTYTIQISSPSGWVFSPSQYTVEIGTVDNCNHNFELTGFEVSGQVVTSSCSGSPDGVTLTLIDKNNKILQTTSSSQGKYSFSNVFPGTYSIEASHQSWSFEKQSISVTFGWANAKITEDIVISGYDIRGQVVEGSNEGVSGVTFLLYGSEGSVDNKNIPCTQIDIDLTKLERKEKPLCGAKSDSKGNFQIENVPCGEYHLIPFYADDVTTFDVRPKEVKVVVDQDSVVISQPFSVQGFSVRGRVINSNGEGVPGVTIQVEGLKDVVTGADGYYRLDGVTSAVYQLKASKPHHVFTNLKDLKITPNVVQLPNVVVTHYDVCGAVSIPQPPVGVVVADRTITVFDDKKQKQFTVKTDKLGYYCVSLPPGHKYIIVPEIDTKEVKSGLLLSHNEAEVVVELEPLLDINFGQARLTVSGQVRCIESPCDTSISVSLSAIGRSSRVTTGLAIAHDDSSPEDYFVFKDVLPGMYEITINHDNWCWDKEKQLVEVTTKDHIETSFAQNGYLVVVSCSHDVEVKYVVDGGSGEVHSEHLKRGRNQFCVSHPGNYVITPESCYQFSSSSYIYNTAQPELLELNAERYQLQGIVEASNAPNNTEIQLVVTNTATQEQTTISATPIPSNSQDKQQPLQFSYTIWASLGDKLRIKPSSPSSPSLFFYPSYLDASVDRNDCPPPLPTMKARPGLYLKGKVTPQVSGVSITISSEEEPTTATTTTITTNEKGEYLFGPLQDDKTYVVSASHPSFYVRRVDDSPSDFELLKLASVSVSVKDQTSGASLAGVLLSLTSSDGYINNNMTNQQGLKEFDSLFPGEYYLRPLLKEYVFSPSSLSISLNEGQNQKVEFKATRVAFSCFGNVKTLNGHPAKFISIEARGVVENSYEETKTDAQGNYRIRGLKPGLSYNIRVKNLENDNNTDSNSTDSNNNDNNNNNNNNDNQNAGLAVERAEPSSVVVDIKDKDVESLNFITFLKDNKFDLIGVINTTNKFLSTLTLQLKGVNGGDIIDEFAFGPSNLFVFNGLDGDAQYTLHLTTKLSTKDYNFTLPTIVVNPKEETFIQLSFNATIRKMEEKMDNGPFFTLVFFCLVVAGVYNRKTISFYVEKFKTRSEKVDNTWGLETKGHSKARTGQKKNKGTKKK